MASDAAEVSARAWRSVAALLMVAVTLIVVYWVAWFAHRSLVASETSAPYMQFEDAFPVADGWLALCMTAAAFCLVTRRRAALVWLLAGAGAGLYLFGMDVLSTSSTASRARHMGEGRQRNVELVINLLTLGLSLFVLRWGWAHHVELLES
jgi:hypothetical protein